MYTNFKHNISYIFTHVLRCLYAIVMDTCAARVQFKASVTSCVLYIFTQSILCSRAIVMDIKDVECEASVTSYLLYSYIFPGCALL